MKRVWGFSLLELMIAITLLGGATALTGVIFSQMSKQNLRQTNDQITRMTVQRAMGEIRREIYNAAYFNPREGFQRADDALFNGIVAFDGTSTPRPPCRHAVDAEGEKFSIVRYTTLLNGLSSEKTLRKWNDNTAGSTALRISLHPEGTSPRHVFQDGDQNAKEILLIDADLTYARRFLVRAVKKIVTDQDPFDDVAKPGSSFVYNEALLSIPATWSGAPQLPASRFFITNSLVYPTATQILCVDNGGSVVLHNEETGKSRSLLSPDKNFSIKRFEVKYLNTKSGQRMERAAFFSFPYGASNDEIFRRQCLNAVLVSLTVTRHSANENSDTVFDDSILINNLNSHRVPKCG